MHISFLFLLLLITSVVGEAQTPTTFTSSELYQQVQKLQVLGSVLYIAAHPDDENTRLLAYLANEKKYRTGYLSLTRGDGGQNLIGDEQGIDLGLIRTQELLAARRIDGAEQFFSRAYDFGFCKSADEALATWGHEEILSDVVWVIRKFKPDVIIARFPEDARAGHGHHAASGILAREAFDAAADPKRFPEQFQQGVTVWQAKRVLWNTFNFGSTNTQNENQFKIDVGLYNPLLGKGYGEMAALSRSQHKSQGFGVPAQRGLSMEYFVPVKGDAPRASLLDGVDETWKRTGAGYEHIEKEVNLLIRQFNIAKPEASVPALIQLYQSVSKLKDAYWRMQKLNQIQALIEQCSGLFLEAAATSATAVQGDTIKLMLTGNNRLGLNVQVQKVQFGETTTTMDTLKTNLNITRNLSVFIPSNMPVSQPYWLVSPMQKGRFVVEDQQLIGRAENEPLQVYFDVLIDGVTFTVKRPIRYKYTDPVRGEIFQPVVIMPPYTMKLSTDLVLNPKDSISGTVFSHTNNPQLRIVRMKNNEVVETAFEGKLNNGAFATFRFQNNPEFLVASSSGKISETGAGKALHYADATTKLPVYEQRKISYDHIPPQTYFVLPKLTIREMDLKTSGHLIGYIPGAGDKVPAALEQMGFQVVILKESDITESHLQSFDAVVAGVRAYNTNDWMGKVYGALMKYVEQGGVFISQYSTSNFISSVKSKIGPYPFTISRNRITDETAKVDFLLPKHPVLNYPNTITAADFDGWIQERSIYNAEGIDSNYQKILSMKDPGELAQEGSLIVANYGKGRFVYTGLVFFRELPAAVPGAFRLFANLLAKPKL